MATVMRKTYSDYFKWRHHYYYTDTHNMRGGVACELCAKLNQDETMRTSYSAFRIWWNRRYENAATCGIRKRHYPIDQGLLSQNVTPPKSEAYNKQISILLWKPTHVFRSFGLGNKIFRDYNCKYDNCFISQTQNKEIPIEHYDAIMITISSAGKNAENLPRGTRSAKQLYVFVEQEASENNPACSAKYNNYFNMTMTYRLDSDIPWPYYEVMTSENTVIGPKEDVLWLESKAMEPTNIELKIKLRKKHKLTAWLVRNCTDEKRTRENANGMRIFVEKFNKELIR